mmetsp:Transcript_28144/g.77377  ORF Transcript_28144/g.77377 Transcript_28144/m.77377 type:complete len:297 (+) Transcript_28144:120-1010(+)
MATKRGGAGLYQQHPTISDNTVTASLSTTQVGLGNSRHKSLSSSKKMGKKQKQARPPLSLSPAQQDLISRLNTNPDTGLSTDEVTARREESGAFNVVKPPIDCPPTVCCLLPCIKHVPSMKAFRSIQPDDAEVLRNNDWIRYDVTSLVTGDIIRLEEGDVVPADCVVLAFSTSHVQELLVDVRAITAEDKPRSAKRIVRRKTEQGDGDEVSFVQPIQLYWGGTVVQGGCIAVVTAIGQECFVATLIAQGKFPPSANALNELAVASGGNYSDKDDQPDESGIALVQASAEPMLRETV